MAAGHGRSGGAPRRSAPRARACVETTLAQPSASWRSGGPLSQCGSARLGFLLDTQPSWCSRAALTTVVVENQAVVLSCMRSEQPRCYSGHPRRRPLWHVRLFWQSGAAHPGVRLSHGKRALTEGEHKTGELEYNEPCCEVLVTRDLRSTRTKGKKGLCSCVISIMSAKTHLFTLHPPHGDETSRPTTPI